MQKKILFILASMLLMASLSGKPAKADLAPIGPLNHRTTPINPQIPNVDPINDDQTTTGVVVVAVSIISLGALIFIRKI